MAQRGRYEDQEPDYRRGYGREDDEADRGRQYGGQPYYGEGGRYDHGDMRRGEGRSDYAPPDYERYGSRGSSSRDRWSGEEYRDEDASASWGRDRGQGGSMRQQAGGDATAEGPHRGKGPRGYARNDDQIREDVCCRLADDSNLDASEIDVEVKDGEVTLGGTVRARPDRRRAEDIADAASGVKHVQNNLRVKPAASGAEEDGADKASSGGAQARGAKRA